MNVVVEFAIVGAECWRRVIGGWVAGIRAEGGFLGLQRGKTKSATVVDVKSEEEKLKCQEEEGWK